MSELIECIQQLCPRAKTFLSSNDDSKHVWMQSMTREKTKLFNLIDKQTGATKYYTSSGDEFKSKNSGTYTGNLNGLTNWLNKFEILDQEWIQHPYRFSPEKVAPKPLNPISTNEIERMLYEIIPEFNNDVRFVRMYQTSLAIKSPSAPNKFVQFELHDNEVKNIKILYYMRELEYSEEKRNKDKEYIQNHIIPYTSYKKFKASGFPGSANYPVITQLPNNTVIFHLENPTINNITNNNNNITNNNNLTNNNTINNFNFNNSIELSKQNNISEIVNHVMKKFPDLKTQFISCSDNKRYVYDFNFGIWKTLNRKESMQYFLNLIENECTHEDFDISYAVNHLTQFVNLIELKCLNSSLTNRFNFNLSLLGVCSVSGELFDLTTVQFVKSKPEFYVSDYCNWIYSENEAIKYYNDVVNFMKILFPLPEVRTMVLKWIACSLNGENNGKRALILTDDTDGDNGKSSLIKLLEYTFDIYAIEGLRYLTSTIEK